MTQNKLKVGILMGGPSVEHEMSLASGEAVINSLDKDKYDAVPIVITRGGEWPVDVQELRDEIDVAFIALHGEYGEDGGVQEALNEVGIPFTGSDVLPSALAMNKIISSRLLTAHGLSVPRFIVAHKHEKTLDSFDHFGYPVIVKPADRGSSVGLSIVRSAEELYVALQKVFNLSNNAIIQEYIPGHEVTCCVLDDGLGDYIPLPVTEIIPKFGGLFDYQAKHIRGASDEITPARLSHEGKTLIQETAVAAHQALGASGVSRTDFIIGDDGELYILEVNTVLGMTSTGLLPQGAKAHGITLAELFERMIEAGMRRSGHLLRDIS